jgi:hypothetical protein
MQPLVGAVHEPRKKRSFAVHARLFHGKHFLAKCLSPFFQLLYICHSLTAWQCVTWTFSWNGVRVRTDVATIKHNYEKMRFRLLRPKTHFGAKSRLLFRAEFPSFFSTYLRSISSGFRGMQTTVGWLHKNVTTHPISACSKSLFRMFFSASNLDRNAASCRFQCKQSLHIPLSHTKKAQTSFDWPFTNFGEESLICTAPMQTVLLI